MLTVCRDREPTAQSRVARLNRWVGDGAANTTPAGTATAIHSSSPRHRYQSAWRSVRLTAAFGRRSPMVGARRITVAGSAMATSPILSIFAMPVALNSAGGRRSIPMARTGAGSGKGISTSTDTAALLSNPESLEHIGGASSNSSGQCPSVSSSTISAITRGAFGLTISSRSATRRTSAGVGNGSTPDLTSGTLSASG